jgi:NTP pyrophosphatase (non-canonical NTP hydrolase)
MTFEEYQRLAQRTSSEKMQLIEKIENGLMGLNGEAGEAIDVLKKHKFQGHRLDRNKLIEELGDVLWYIAETCEGLGVSMEEVARLNIEKLKKRYPEGFSSERSINRKEEG